MRARACPWRAFGHVMSHSVQVGIGSPAPVKADVGDAPKSRPARSAAVPLMGSPSARDNINRRKSLAQQIESIEQHTEGEKNVAPIPSIPQHLSPRSPHMRRASRSPKTKSTNMSPSSGAEKTATEVPSISTEELARLLHGGGGGDGNKSGPPSPKGEPGLSPGRVHSPGRSGGGPASKPVTKERSHSVAVAALSEQLKEKEAVVAVPVPMAARKLTLGGDEHTAHVAGSPGK